MKWYQILLIWSLWSGCRVSDISTSRSSRRILVLSSTLSVQRGVDWYIFVSAGLIRLYMMWVTRIWYVSCWVFFEGVWCCDQSLDMDTDTINDSRWHTGRKIRKCDFYWRLIGSAKLSRPFLFSYEIWSCSWYFTVDSSWFVPWVYGECGYGGFKCPSLCTIVYLWDMRYTLEPWIWLPSIGSRGDGYTTICVRVSLRDPETIPA